MMDRAHGGNIGRYSVNISRLKRKIIDFSANINPLGLPPGARRAILKNIAGVASYPEPNSRSLKMALAKFHRISETNLTVGNGSIELINLIPKAMGAGKVLIATPTFSEYEFAAKTAGATIMFFKTKERNDFKISMKDFIAYIPHSNLVFLCNPNNPTGSPLSASDLLTLVNVCLKHGTILVLDEAFMDFAERCENTDMVRMASKVRGIFVVRSLTKFFAMPGLRLGYCISHPDYIKRISSLQYPWNVNSLAQAAGQEAIKDISYMRESKRCFLEDRTYLFNKLDGIKGLKVLPSASNFMLCKLEGAAVKSANILNRRLIGHGMVVRDCSNFRGLNEKYFRVAVRRRRETTRLITALKEILAV